MKCPTCTNKLHVTHTEQRSAPTGSPYVYRQRHCNACGADVRTAEVAVEKLTTLRMAGVPVIAEAAGILDNQLEGAR